MVDEGPVVKVNEPQWSHGRAKLQRQLQNIQRIWERQWRRHILGRGLSDEHFHVFRVKAAKALIASGL